MTKNRVVNLLLGLSILAAVVLSYALRIHKTGFFLDDWYIIGTYRAFGASRFVEYFSGDRPYLAYLYQIFMPIFRDSIPGWQIFALVTKYLSALVFWRLLSVALPGRNAFNYAAALLFAVYPGFQFHNFVIMYSQTYLLFAVYLLSYLFMIKAIRLPERAWVYTIPAILCQFIGIVPMEYFYGLELARPVVLFCLFEGLTTKDRFKSALRAYWPYTVVFLGFTFFRIVNSSKFGYPIGILSQLKDAPQQTILSIFLKAAQTLFEACINLWYQAGQILLYAFGRETFILTLLSAVAFLAFFFFITKIQKADSRGTGSGSLIFLGLFLILVAMTPFIAAGFKITLEFPNNRFMLALSIGASIFSVALLDWALRTQNQKIFLMSVLVSLSIGSNFAVTRAYEKVWRAQTDFFRQLVWRAPQIKPNTALLTPEFPFAQYFSGFSLTAPLNAIYAPERKGNPLPYYIIQTASDERTANMDFSAGKPLRAAARSLNFEGNTSDTLALYMPPRGCLQVLAPDFDPAAFKDEETSDYWQEIIPLSNLNRIETDPATPAELPARYFGTVSTNTWCYYFQKAELANQRGDWKESARLYALTIEKELKPDTAADYLPFIRAILKAGNPAAALEISISLKDLDTFTKSSLCQIWSSQKSEFLASISSSMKLWECETK